MSDTCSSYNLALQFQSCHRVTVLKSQEVVHVDHLGNGIECHEELQESELLVKYQQDNRARLVENPHHDLYLFQIDLDLTRKHFSRMRTGLLPTVRASATPDVSTVDGPCTVRFSSEQV